MHASRALPGSEQLASVTASLISTATASGTITYDAVASSKGIIKDSNMKYVHLISAAPQHQEASTSYARNTDGNMMSTSATNYCNPPQELYQNGQIITGTASDGSIVEYVIDNHDYDGNTMYVEVLPEMDVPGSENGSNNSQQISIDTNGVISGTGSYGDMIGDEPVKKSRYSRMSSEDRERYNARRRARRREKKRLLEEAKIRTGIDELEEPEPVEQQELLPISEFVVKAEPIREFPVAQLVQNITPSLDEKPTNSRNRYNEMSEEQRREYNAKKAAAYRKKREEEELILSHFTEKPLIDDQDSQAQDILIRNARRAERARLRYQRLTPDERREYNMRRTLAKRAKKEAQTKEDTVNRAEHIESFATPVKNEAGTISSVSEEALSKLEKDVVRRTMAAQMHLKQKEDKRFVEPVSSTSSFNSIDETIEHVATYGPSLSEHEIISQMPMQEFVEQPSALPLVFVDQNGNPASLPEGTVIEIRQDHPNGPQTIIIHTTAPFQAVPDSMQYTPTNNVVSISNALPTNPQLDYSSDSTLQKYQPATPKSEAARVKRAERARQRYHNMSEEVRKEFNAKRSVALRRSRLRDEELCRLNDQARHEGQILDEETQKAVTDALARRAKRAESARQKYQRMSADERRAYNANRDAVRKSRRHDDGSESQRSAGSPDSVVIVVDDEPLDFKFG